MILSISWGSQKFSRLTWRLTTRSNKSFVHTKRIVWTQWFWHLGMFWIHPLTFAHEGFGCNFWVIAFVWGAGGLLFLLNFPYHIETPIMWCKKLCLLDCSEDLAWLARVINHRRQKQLLPVTCVLVVRKTRMVGKAVGPDFEECPAREFFLKDPRAWPSVSKRLSWERRMRKSLALWIFWLANISYSTAICGIRNVNGVGIRVAGGLSTHFGEWPHVCSILRFQII